MLQSVKEQFAAMVAGGAFEPVRRNLTAIEQDDRMAEAVGQVWALAARKAELGIKMDSALLVHAVKLRAIDHRRQLPRGGQPRRDVMHFANFIDGKVVVHRLDGLLDEDGDYTGEGDTELQSAWLAATSADPANTLASAVDLHEWVGTLPLADRKLLEARFAGNTLAEIAASTDTSISWVFARLRRLGVDLAARAGVSPASSAPPRAPRICNKIRSAAA